MGPRVTYVRKHSYNTRSNAIRIVKTAGGKFTVHHRGKQSNGVKCGDCGRILPGIRHIRPHEYKWLPKCKRTVARAYGGVRCHKCVQNKILRSFLISEHNLIKMAAAKKFADEKKQAAEENKKKIAKKTQKK
ncbi:60S ribosomal protein L34 [Entamoeba marina]